MCGRFAQNTTLEALIKQFIIPGKVLPFQAQYNIDPGDGRGREPDRAFVVASMGGERRLIPMAWSYAPPWADSPFSTRSTFNARSDRLTSSPMWRPAFQQKRCVVPMTGFFEFPGAKGHKTPHYIFMKDRPLFGVAGLWSGWQSKDKTETLSTFTIVTCEANDFMLPLHPKGRMPVILEAKDEATWLDPKNKDMDALLELARPCPSEAMETYPVGDIVKNPLSDGEQCVTEVPPPPETMELF